MFSIFEEVRKKKLSSSFLFFLSSGSMLRMLNCSILYEWDSCIGFYELEFSRDLCDIPSVMRDTREGVTSRRSNIPMGDVTKGRVISRVCYGDKIDLALTRRQSRCSGAYFGVVARWYGLVSSDVLRN